MKRLASLLLALALCLLPLTTALAGDDYAGLAGGAVLRRGNRGEAVEKLQKALAIMLLAYRSSILKREAYALYGEIDL